jgi:hypothetical protein
VIPQNALVEEGVLSLRCIAADAGSYKESAQVPAQNEAGNIHCNFSRAAEAAVRSQLKYFSEIAGGRIQLRLPVCQQSGSLAVTGK